MKALEIHKDYRDAIIIAADTIVVNGREILGKPKDSSEAEIFLRKLSGKSHKVITSICVIEGEKQPVVKAATTKVKFAKIDNFLLEKYIATGEWHDAAGAYKIQGQSQGFIKSIKGSYSNVVGLPLNEIYGILRATDFR